MATKPPFIFRAGLVATIAFAAALLFGGGGREVYYTMEGKRTLQPFGKNIPIQVISMHQARELAPELIATDTPFIVRAGQDDGVDEIKREFASFMSESQRTVRVDLLNYDVGQVCVIGGE